MDRGRARHVDLNRDLGGNWTDAQWTGTGPSSPDVTDNVIIDSPELVQAASAQAAHALAISGGGQVAVVPGASLAVTNDTSVTGGSALDVAANGVFSTGGILTVDTGGSVNGGAPGTPGRVNAAAFQLNNGSVSTDLSGSGGVTVSGDGTNSMMLWGTNSYAGPTTVEEGTLYVGCRRGPADRHGTRDRRRRALIFDPRTVPLPTAGGLTSLLAASTASAVFGQLVTFTDTLTSYLPIATVPTGTVTFLDGGRPLGTGTFAGNGQWTFSTSALAVGSHTITAAYGGDANFGATTSSGLSESVGRANTEHGPGLDGQPGGLWAVGDLHGDRRHRFARRGHADGHGDVLRQLGTDRRPGDVDQRHGAVLHFDFGPGQPYDHGLL